MTWSVHPVQGAQSISSLLVSSTGQLWGVSGGTLFQLDPATGSLIRQLHLTTEAQPDTVTWSVAQLVEVDGLLLVASRGSLQAVDTDASTVTTIQAGGVAPNRVAVMNGDVFYPMGSSLVRATLERDGGGARPDQ